jgi:dihydrofolate synthase/folylpolyglutamate synthase
LTIATSTAVCAPALPAPAGERFPTLTDWLAWQERLHPSRIELGLERVRQVGSRLGLQAMPYPVITVAGTNGKGSSVAMLEAILTAAGYRVGAYTSPHLRSYNERVRMNGRLASDVELCTAFAQIDRVRGETPLTYFEFGTLAALQLFQQARLDVAVLEVGMGGRLDAVNIVDADVALVTTIALDHTEWLGPDRESIGREKAGIFRPQRPAVYNDLDPPLSLVHHAGELRAPLYRLGRDYAYVQGEDAWSWRGRTRRYDVLPLPALAGGFQLRNAAGTLGVLEAIEQRLPVSLSAIREGLAQVRLPGRFEQIPGAVQRILDVAHNPQAAAVLAEALREQPCAGRTLAVFSMLHDKDSEGVMGVMAERVDTWHIAELATVRAASAAALVARLSAVTAVPIRQHERISLAYRAALAESRPGDRVVVFGSFYTVAEVLAEGL